MKRCILSTTDTVSVYAPVLQRRNKTLHNSSFRMIGLIDKIFPDRGYGFALALPPPVLPDATPSSSAEAAPLGDGGTPSPRKEPVSIWFPIPKRPSHAPGHESRVGSVASQFQRGAYVALIATWHNNPVKQTVEWRASRVTLCDVQVEFNMALRRVRDVRWDRITQEDVEREKQRITWWYNTRTHSPLHMSQQTSHQNAPQGSKKEEEEEQNATLDDQLTREMLQKRLKRFTDTSREFLIRDEDLTRHIAQLRHTRVVSAGTGAVRANMGSKGVEDTYQLSKDEQRRWDNVLRSLEDHDVA